ncbi:MAG: site-specific integrase [Planctomycetaceae bacterium]
MSGKKSKAANGEGSVYQEGGRWVAAVSMSPGTRPVRRRRATKSEAIAAKQELLAQRVTGDYKAPSTKSLASLIRSWKAYQKFKNLAPATQSLYTLLIDTWVLPYLGTEVIRKIDNVRISDWMNSIQEKGANPPVVSVTRKVLISIFNFGINEVKWTETNPAKEVPAPSYDSKPIQLFSAEEADTLIMFAREDSQYGLVPIIGLTMGLRLGEILGLRWDAFDFTKEKPTLTVRRILDHTHSPPSIKERPKTKTSRRTLQIPRLLLNLLTDRIEQTNDWSSKEVQGEYLFLSQRNQHPGASTIYAYWYRLLRRAGLEKRKFHNTRHTYATRLLNSRVPIKLVSVMLGHNNVKTTIDTYWHYVDADQQVAIDAVDSLYGCD